MKDLLNYIIATITGKDLEIKEETNDNFTNLTVKVPKEFMGLLIGKEGRVVKSIRNILKVRATLEKKGLNINLEEATS
jgi:predicted RNA-binding protein YlqC (UPF0109 family)